MVVLSDRLAGPWGDTLSYVIFVLYDVITLTSYIHEDIFVSDDVIVFPCSTPSK